MATVEIIPRIPPEAIVPPLESSSEYILNRQRGEFVTPLTNYSYSNASQIIIDVASPTSFWDPSNSYVRMFLQVTGNVTQVNANGQVDASNTTAYADLRQYLAEGGVQALFRNITVSTLSGTELSRVSLGNRLQAIFRNATRSKEYIDRVMWREGDSSEPLPEFTKVCIYNWSSIGYSAAGTITSVTDVAQQVYRDWGAILFNPNVAAPAGGTVDENICELHFTNIGTSGGVTGFAYRDIQIGDEIQISYTTVGIHGAAYLLQVCALNTSLATVSTVAANVGSLLCRIISASGSDAYDQEVGGNNISSFAVFRYKCNFPMRNYICALTNGAIAQYWANNQRIAPATVNGVHHSTGINPFYTVAPIEGTAFAGSLGGFEVCFQPFHPILISQIWWPLMLIRGGLRITFDLERPDFCFVTGSAGLVSNWGYTISNFQYVCDIIQPTQTLTNEYLDLYANDALNYHLIGFIQQLDQQVGAGNTTMATRLFPSVRSAIHYICQIQDPRAINTVGTGNSQSGTAYNIGTDAAYVDSCAQGLWSYLGNFQIDIGTERYPLARPLVMDDNNNAYSYNSLAEMMIQLEYCLNSLGVQNMSKNLDKELFTPLHTGRSNYLWNYMQKGINSALVTSPNTGIYQGVVEADRFYICISLQRHDSPFCGINVKDNAIQPNFTFNGTALNYTWGSDAASASKSTIRYFNQYISYDSTVSIGKSGLIQRR